MFSAESPTYMLRSSTMPTDDDDDDTRERDILSCGEIDESGNIEIDVSCADKSGKSFGNKACETAGDETR